MSGAAGLAGALAGMERATRATERRKPGWSVLALAYVEGFAAFGKPFTSPEVREFAYADGLPRPSSDMAWGGVFRSASARKLIRKDGFCDYGDDTMHTQPIVVWRAA